MQVILGPVSAEPTSDPFASSTVVPQTNGKTNKHWRVLLVDDHATIRSILRSLLEAHADIQVIGEASEGQQAVELAEFYRPDVIVMDVQLPQVNGVEATRRIIRKLPHIVIIAVSMQYTPHTYNAMITAGAVAFVRKEDAAEMLYKTIRFSMHASCPTRHPSALRLVPMKRE